jgi:hypothetical protein
MWSFPQFLPAYIKIPVNAYSSLGVISFQFSVYFSPELQKTAFTFLDDTVRIYSTIFLLNTTEIDKILFASFLNLD